MMGARIKVVYENFFLFEFYDEIDVQRVLDDDLWSHGFQHARIGEICYAHACGMFVFTNGR